MSQLCTSFCAIALLIAAHPGGLQAASEFVGPGGSMAPELTAGADGNLYLSWIEAQGDGHALRFSTFDDDGWSDALTVATGDDWFVNWSDWPAVTALGNGVLVANWRRRNGTAALAYEIRMAPSQDGGKTWDTPFTLNDDATPTQHGFVSILPGNATLDVMWLDGRRTAAGAGEDEAMTLRHAVVNADGSVGESVEVDAQTCDCCQTSVVRVPPGLLVAYRDRTRDEIRDIAVREHSDGRWGPAKLVHEDSWEFAGCPVNGPALDARESTVAVAWFTAANGQARVLAAQSTDGGRSFGAPILVSDNRSLGRTDVILLENAEMIVSWSERRLFSSRVMLRRIRGDGIAEDARLLREIDIVANGFPRMVRRGNSIVIAWTEKAGRAGRVRAIVIPADEV